MIQRLLDDFATHASPDQAKVVAEAVEASPALVHQLNDLAESGQFTGFTLGSEPLQPRTPFRATIDHGKILFSPGFLAQPSKKRLFDVVMADDILPNNLVFALGGLAFHLQQAGTPLPRPTQASDLGRLVALKIVEDARSFIQGWNDVVDAAIQENKGQSVTARQQSNLLLNLRYRAVFIRDVSKLSFSASGEIAPSDQNVSVLASALGTTGLLDFGAPFAP